MTKQTKQNRKGQIKKLGPIGKVSQLDDDQKEAEEINGGGESTQLLLRERKKERKKVRKGQNQKRLMRRLENSFWERLHI